MADGVQDEAEMKEENIDEDGGGAAEEGEEGIYEVEKIVGMCNTKGKILYKVRWQGYNPQWDTWEPYENLESCRDMIKTYVEVETKKEKGGSSKEDGEISGLGGDAMSEKSGSSKIDGKRKRQKGGYYYVSDDSEEADTLKDKFWRDLEHGKINVFEGDMYSKVKGAGVRQSRPQSIPEMDESQKPDSPEPEVKPAGKGKPRKKSDSQKPKNKGVAVKRQGSGTDGTKKRGRKRKSTDAAFEKQDSVSSLTDVKVKDEDSNSSSFVSQEDFAGSDQKANSEDGNVKSIDSDSTTQDEATHFYLLCNRPNGCSDSPLTYRSPTINHSQSSTSNSTVHKSSPVQSPSACSSLEEGEIVDSSSNSSAGYNGQENPSGTSYSQLTCTTAKQSRSSADSAAMDTDTPSATKSQEPMDTSSISSTMGSQSHYTIKDRRQSATSRDTLNPATSSDLEHQPPSVGGNTAPLSVGESEVSGDSGHVDIDSLPRSNNSLINTHEMADEEFEFDLDEIDGMEWDGKVIDHTSMPVISSNVELRQAVKVNDYQRVSQAFRSGRAYDLEQCEHGGLSLAMIAAQQGFDDLLELLVMRGASIHTEQKGTGVTALMLAAEQGLRCTVALLLEMGAHINSQTPNGETALIKAIRRLHVNVVKLLLDHGANFASTHGGEHTAMRCAKMTNHNEIIQILSSHISRVTAEFENQVKITLNNTATILTALFPIQCFALREADKVKISFKHELEPTRPGRGILLFIAHARVTSDECRCRFYGPCAVKTASLNNVTLKSVTEESNFVCSFSPLHNGRNDLEITTARVPMSRAKLVVCAYQAQLI